MAKSIINMYLEIKNIDRIRGLNENYTKIIENKNEYVLVRKISPTTDTYIVIIREGKVYELLNEIWFGLYILSDIDYIFEAFHDDNSYMVELQDMMDMVKFEGKITQLLKERKQL
jgi:hypothetical protein